MGHAAASDNAANRPGPDAAAPSRRAWASWLRTTSRYPLRPASARACPCALAPDNLSMYTKMLSARTTRSSVATSAATAVADMCSHDTRAPVRYADSKASRLRPRSSSPAPIRS